MKKLLYLLFIIAFIGCSNNDKSDVVAEECGCVKINYHQYFGSANQNSYVNMETGRENVPCQESEISVTTAVINGGEYYYYNICCDNIDDPTSNCK